VAVKKIENDPDNQAKVFSQPHQIKEAIIAAGEKALVSMYGGAEDEGLDSLRYRWFCDKVSKFNAAMEPQSLPPTSGSSKYHSLRVYDQVIEWKDACINIAQRIWDGTLLTGHICQYRPTNQPLHQNCEMSSVVAVKRTVPTERCTCRKYGLPCTNVCRERCGVSCSNSQLPDLSNASDKDG